MLQILCTQHLLGEHGELHKFLPSFRKRARVDGRIFPIVQIELSSYKQRHDALAAEMLRRWPKPNGHATPLGEEDLPDFFYLPREHFLAKVDRQLALQNLLSHCPECRARAMIILKERVLP